MALAEPARLKRDRDEVFVEVTRSICPVCKSVVDAQVNIRDDKVYLRKRCPEHGWFEALVYGDAQMYVDSVRFNKPGRSRWPSRPRCAMAARPTVGCVRSTSSTHVWASSR